MPSLDSLNPPQREAVLHHKGPLVVFAGAGSGKTRVITYRIAHMVGEHRVPAYRILSVTFTNKAAGEMRERLEHLLPGSSRDLWVGTFHSVCVRLLRRYHEPMGIARDFVIYDDADQKAMVTRVLRDLKLDEKRFPPKQVAHAIGKAKQELITPDNFEANDPFTDRVRDVYASYEKRMRLASALDFDDLIGRVTLATEADASLRAELAKRFEYVLVDEFQDTNHAQSRLVNAIAGGHRNLCVVGDDDQSIYRWRGADRRNILDFRRVFPEARVVKLEQNYRSTKRILRVSNAVIARNLDREPKQLFTDNDEGSKVLVVRCEDERDEARLAVRAVRELLGDGYKLSDFVLFYRTHAQSRVFEEAFRGANIQYRVVGGVRFYDRAEVKDVLAYLRLIKNPDDDVSLLRVINKPIRGIGKTTIERLLDAAAQEGTSVWAILRKSEAILGAAGKKKIEPFLSLIDELRALDQRGAELVEIATTAVERSEYLAMLKDDDTPEADARLENVRELLGSIQEFQADAETPTLEAFLELVTLQSQADTIDAQERMTLMTIHAAKGLEFPVVMVAGLEERLFPMRGTDPFEDPEELEEERRLAYVAFTRARERLILSYAAMRRLFGEARIGIPSRFIGEMPEADITRIGVAPSRPSYAPSPSSSYPPRGDWSHPQNRPRSSAPPPSRDSYVDRDDAPRSSSRESYVDRSDGEGTELRRGMRVRHVKFGVGEVRSVQEGLPPRVEVTFPGWGTRKIAASYLEPV